MHQIQSLGPLVSAFAAVGEYVVHAESPSVQASQSPPIFDYPTTISKVFNKNLKSEFVRGVNSLKIFPITNASFYILNIPFSPSQDFAHANAKWTKLVTIIREESFGKSAAESCVAIQIRALAIIGINRVTSIDREDDYLFREWSRRIPVEGWGFHCRILSNLWKSNFILAGGQTIDHQIAQLAFIVLEYLNIDIANAAKKHLASSKLFRDQIPFIHIREWIKNDMLSLPGLDERFEKQPVYMSIMDDDPVHFRSGGQGLFSEYDQIVSSRPAAPQLMSTGYFAPDTADLATQLAFVLDMRIREALSKVISDAPYFPEPNTCILINDSAIRSKLSFLSNSDVLDTENRRLISNIRPLLDLSRITFIARACLVTTVPERMVASKSLRDLSVENLGQKTFLPSLKGISQTHADLSILSNNIWISLNPPKPDMFSFKGIFSPILQCFDPIVLVDAMPRGTSNYNYKSFIFLMRLYPLWVQSLWTTTVEGSSNREEAWAKSAYEVAKIIWPKSSLNAERYIDAFRALSDKLTKAIQEAGRQLERDQVYKVLAAAQAVGNAMYEVLSHYCNLQ